MFHEGISKTGDLLDMATTLGVIEKRGAFFSYGELRLGQGRENAKAFLAENSDLTAEIEQKVRDTAGLTRQGGVASAPFMMKGEKDAEDLEGEESLDE
jgi:recombination protein RecA